MAKLIRLALLAAAWLSAAAMAVFVVWGAIKILQFAWGQGTGDGIFISLTVAMLAFMAAMGAYGLWGKRE